VRVSSGGRWREPHYSFRVSSGVCGLGRWGSSVSGRDTSGPPGCSGCWSGCGDFGSLGFGSEELFVFVEKIKAHFVSLLLPHRYWGVKKAAPTRCTARAAAWSHMVFSGWPIHGTAHTTADKTATPLYHLSRVRQVFPRAPVGEQRSCAGRRYNPPSRRAPSRPYNEEPSFSIPVVPPLSRHLV